MLIYIKLHSILWLLLFAVFILGLLYIGIPHANNNKNSSFTKHPSALDNIHPITVSDHMRGNQNAKVTLLEYSDFECPSCQLFQPTIRQIINTYGNKIRWVVRHYPLPQHVNAEKEAEAAECAAAIGGNNAYWSFTDRFFSRVKSSVDGTGFSLANLVPLAQEVGINKKKFQDCLDSGKYYQHVQDQIADAETGGIQQLPSTVIINAQGGKQLITSNQSFTVFKTIIDQDLSE